MQFKTNRITSDISSINLPGGDGHDGRILDCSARAARISGSNEATALQGTAAAATGGNAERRVEIEAAIRVSS